MRRRKHFDKAIRILAAGLWLAGWAAFPSVGEAAQSAHALPSDSVIAGSSPAGGRREPVRIQAARPEGVRRETPGSAENAADRIWSRVRQGENSGEPILNQGPQQKPAATDYPYENAVRSASPAPVQGITGYTEAEIRAQMVKKYTPPRPAFRRVSGAVTGADYRAGTMDVKIPTLFFPPDVMQDVSETFPENPDGTFGTRSPEDKISGFSSYGAEAKKQLLEQAGRKTGTGAVKSPVQQKKPLYNSSSSSRYKTITVQVPVSAPSPFRPLAKGDFYWFTNNKGHYMVALPQSMPYDPLQKLPAYGPMLIRNTSQNEFMAVTVDDPSDTYYYKNQDTFPAYGRAVPVFTETRKSIQGYDVAIKYIRYYLGGEYCLIVDSTGKRAGKTYRTAFIFPEQKQYEYLPKVLFSIENLKGM